MISELSLNTSPTKSDFLIVGEWLIDEYNTLNEGFYCNWAIIEKAFIRGDFVTIDYFGKPVGFIVWRNEGIYAEIDILEIKPDQRRKGIGDFFLNEFSNFLRGHEIVAIKLFCSPIESEKFWKRLDFMKFPKRRHSESELTYYRPLIELLSISEKNTVYKIELWDAEPYQIKNRLSKWTWFIESIDSKFNKPILQPCDCNWNLRWTENGTIINEGKIKYFNTFENRIHYGPFLFINKWIK